MNSTEILALLEKPSRNGWTFVYQIRDEAAVEDIIAALRASAAPSTRSLLCYILNLRAGAEFFEGRSSETKQAVPALIEVLADSDAGVRSEAIDALGHIGDPAAGPALLEAYHKAEGDSDLRIWLASTAGFCQYAPAIPLLIEALASPKSSLRHEATQGLRHLQAQEAKEPLRKALAQESDPLTRQRIQETLQEFEDTSTYEEKIDRFIAQLRNAETTDEREAAAAALGDMDTRVLVPLLALLNDRQSEVRQYATVAISGLSEHRDAAWFVRAYREQVQGPLILALTDQESNVRAAAAQALGQWGDQRAVEPLLAVIQDTDVEVRRAVVAALTYPKDERALEPLLNAFFTDDDMQVRAYAAEGLGRHLEDNRAVNTLIQALQDNNPEVREWSIEALWEICIGNGNDLSAEAMEKMRKPLIQALQDENREMRERAKKIKAWLDG